MATCSLPQRAPSDEVQPSSDAPAAASTRTTPAPFYVDHPGQLLSASVRTFFTSYAHVPPDEVETHLISARARAWSLAPYPCIGLFRFLDVDSFRATPSYEMILRRMRSDEAIMLDVGTCFGKELRILAADNAPTDRMYGVDLKPGLWDVGFDLYRDRDSFNAKFFEEDFIAPLQETAKSDMMVELEGRCDVINVALFFHLFSREQQLAALERIVRLSRVGCLVVGRHIGRVPAGVVEQQHGWKERFLHDENSWRDIWGEVEECTKTNWKIEAHLMDMDKIKSARKDELAWMADVRMLLYFLWTSTK